MPKSHELPDLDIETVTQPLIDGFEVLTKIAKRLSSVMALHLHWS